MSVLKVIFQNIFWSILNKSSIGFILFIQSQFYTVQIPTFLITNNVYKLMSIVLESYTRIKGNLIYYSL